LPTAGDYPYSVRNVQRSRAQEKGVEELNGIGLDGTTTLEVASADRVKLSAQRLHDLHEWS